MATLVSPGVAVSITDESFYGPAGPGTVPLMVVATGEDKAHVSGTGVATGTSKANAGKPQLTTSQFELSQNFGNPSFGVNGDELNEYGLLAAYSFLGAANQAYIVRADVDTSELAPATAEPKGPPADGTYWLDTANTEWGIFESTAAGTTSWAKQTVTVFTGAPSGGVDGDYAVDVSVVPVQFHKNVATTWTAVTTAALAGAVNVSDHTSVPTATAAGDVWLKTSTPNEGFNPVVKLYSASSNTFSSITVTTAPTAPTTSVTGFLWADTTPSDAEFSLLRWDGAAFAALSYEALAIAPTGATTDGTLWYDGASTYIDLYKNDGAGAWAQIVSGDITLASTQPAVGAANKVWVDTDDVDYPAIYESDGAAWVRRDNSDQTTNNGVEFADHTKVTAWPAGGATVGAVLSGGPDPLLYPGGMFLVNLAASSKVVRKFVAANAAGEQWVTESSNNADGSGTFGRFAQRKVIVSGMQAAVAGSTLREETVAVTLLAAPGYPELADELSTLNTDRKETAFVVLDAPFRKSPTEIITWISNTTAAENGEDGLNTKNSGSAIYYPNALSTNTDGTTVMVPASHVALRSMAYSDSVSYQWFAPAGLTRGRVDNATSVGYLNSEGDFTPVALTEGQRDSLYNNYMNPIANFPDSGLTLWGQKTLHGTATAMDRINVSRLVAYLRERFDVIARPFIFEQNDKSTRDNVLRVFDGFLSDIMSKRGVYDYAVVCDTTNNTPARIDRNELYVDIAIEPTKVAEFIYIPIRIMSTGAIATSP